MISMIFFSLRAAVGRKSSVQPLLLLSGGKPKKLKLAKKASDRFEKRDDNKKDNKALR